MIFLSEPRLCHMNITYAFTTSRCPTLNSISLLKTNAPASKVIFTWQVHLYSHNTACDSAAKSTFLNISVDSFWSFFLILCHQRKLPKHSNSTRCSWEEEQLQQLFNTWVGCWDDCGCRRMHRRGWVCLCVCVCVRWHKTTCFFSCVSDRGWAADKRSRRRSSSETGSQLNTAQVDLQKKKKSVVNGWQQTPERVPLSFILHTHTPTCLHGDSGNLSGYFAHVSGVVREIVCEARQGHPVAAWLQLLHRAFVLELVLGRWTGHVGVNEWLFVARGPRKLVAVDLVRLGLDQTVHSQVSVIFNTHCDLVTALCWNQQHWSKTKKGMLKHGGDESVYNRFYLRYICFTKVQVFSKYLLKLILTSQHSAHKQRLEHDAEAPIQLWKTTEEMWEMWAAHSFAVTRLIELWSFFRLSSGRSASPGSGEVISGEVIITSFRSQRQEEEEEEE